MKKIIVSAVSTPVSISYIKHLQNIGFHVIGIDMNESSLAEKACDQFYKVPPVDKHKEYISYISKIDFDLFLPWLDEEHRLFAKEKDNISFYDKVITSTPSSILIATDKFATFEFCKREGIEVSPLKKDAPAFLRKQFSRGSKNAFLESDSERLKLYSDDEYLKQKPLAGPEYTVDVLCDLSGKMIFQVPRIRRSATNVSLIGEISMDKRIMEFTKKICEKFTFKGCINIQMMKDMNDVYLIEINPRLAGSSILTINAGFDLLHASLKLFSGQSISNNFYINPDLKMYRFYNEYYTT